MIRNKRGWVAILTVIMLGVIIGIVVYSYVLPWQVKEVMGERQSAILDSYSVGEQARVYVEDAAEISAQQALAEIGSGDISTFEEKFLFYFEEYLSSYDLPSYEEDDFYTLYDVVDYELEISVGKDKIGIVGYPRFESYTFPEEDETGEVVEVTYEYESAIEIGSEMYNFDYILDPYFSIEIDY